MYSLVIRLEKDTNAVNLYPGQEPALNNIRSGHALVGVRKCCVRGAFSQVEGLHRAVFDSVGSIPCVLLLLKQHLYSRVLVSSGHHRNPELRRISLLSIRALTLKQKDHHFYGLPYFINVAWITS